MSIFNSAKKFFLKQIIKFFLNKLKGNNNMTGWKTWTAGILAILYGVGVLGIYQNDWNAAVEMILFGLGLLGIGHKIEKASK